MALRRLVAAIFPVLVMAQDPRDIVRRGVETDSRNDQLARDYTYVQREERRSLDASGGVKDVKSETYDVMLIDGTRYRRLVTRDDRPLPAAEQRKEEERQAKEAEKRRKETESQRLKRIEEAERRRQKNREQNREITEAFDFRLLGEDSVDGTPVWIIGGTPRKGFRASTAAGRALLPKLDCKLWISKSDYGWVRLEIETLDTVSFGLAIVRVAKGSRIVMEQTRVNEEIWLPKRIVVTANARLFLVKSTRIDVRYDYSEYKKFQADSRIVGYQEKK